MKTQVMLIGIGGASCSGKTTLAAKLCSVLPGCSILHQDDFWTEPKSIPMHPVYNLPNAEDAEFAIEWPRFRAAVTQFKANSFSPGDTLDPNNTELGLAPDVTSPSSSYSSLPENFVNEWRDRFGQVAHEWLKQGVKLEWRMVEGFFLFYDSKVVENLDVQVFLRSPRHILQQRRISRTYTYPDGETWVDPPGYWEQIAYPGYVRAHSHLFNEGNVDSGNLTLEAQASNLIVLNGQGTEQDLSFKDLFNATASAVLLKSQPRQQ